MKYLNSAPIHFGGFDGDTWDRVFGGKEMPGENTTNADGLLKDTYPKKKKDEGWKRNVIEFLFTSAGKPESEGSHSLLEERKKKIDEAADMADNPNSGFKKAKGK
jgi:hypothetical protein